MTKSKVASRKFLITIWAIVMLTLALIMRVDLPWFTGLAPILGAIVVTYIGVQGYVDAQKEKTTSKKDSQD